MAHQRSSEPLPEPLFLDYRVSDLLDMTIRMPRFEPWTSQYCTAITEKRYGDALWARYHMSPDAKDGVITDMRDLGNDKFEAHETPVYDEIMMDAKGYAEGNPDTYRKALVFYSSTSPSDSHQDIIKGLFGVGAEVGISL
ncbi:uncharacterized protein N7483_012404 [Penicillium malachiteum]|uniref:uncharacterized protein n=1 Tax=Penicillium malachiteum TaxID=1324776 RepID=UPI0025483F5A|nr:uncharacterized protein N7483_012404 [Penicillium malachiteum]KAJ5715223.1 hypothetical protein N7483_012404 [Penicillium malachiteum]